MTTHLPKATIIRYPQGETCGTGTVVKTIPLDDNRSAILVDNTPFHPVDYQWPDQPGDRGEIHCDGRVYPVVSCLTGAINLEDDTLYLDTDIPVKKGADGWCFVVAHVIDGTPDLTGKTVQLQVDASYRHALDCGHSACHIAALALNRALQGYWRKDPGRHDALGQIDFDQQAITLSSIGEYHSSDRYRCGKSLKKKGLNAADVLTDLNDIEKAINQQLATWLEEGGEIHVRCEGETLTDRRYWECQLGQEDKVVIPCGGSHANTLGALGKVTVSMHVLDEQTFEVITRCQP
ncbi:hypothetical protein GCM10023116_35960 [Kistimonas scapharcae]|uniref:Metal-dependent hydrolase n=1 Tax=Kistimonas scapharcae TaxID=1036133 RepID=A0ABP8V601_9GAMM